MMIVIKREIWCCHIFKAAAKYSINCFGYKKSAFMDIFLKFSIVLAMSLDLITFTIF